MNHRTLWLASALVAFLLQVAEPTSTSNRFSRHRRGRLSSRVAAGPRPAPKAPPKPKVGDLEDPILPDRELSGFVDGEVKTWAIKQEPIVAPRSNGKGTTGTPPSPQSPQSNATDPKAATIPGNALSSFTNNNSTSWKSRPGFTCPSKRLPDSGLVPRRRDRYVSVRRIRSSHAVASCNFSHSRSTTPTPPTAA